MPIDEGKLFDGNDHGLFDLPFPFARGNLNIDWNSDDHDGGNSANRSVAFQFSTAADNVIVKDSGGNVITGLTSDGHAVNYAIINGDLVGYTGSNPHFNQVFVVSLNDDGTGSYTFTLLGNLDHPAAHGENTLTFTFDYTATDSDGDPSSNVFSVTVKDDIPAAHTGDSSFVDEDDLPNGTSPHASDLTVSGDLNIAWGADNANPTSHGGLGDRSVAFTSSTAGHNVEAQDSHGHDLTLKSGGQTVNYAFDSNGTLVGYTGASLATGTRIFEVSLSDAGDGSYTFKLLGNLDHPTDNGHNTINLSFSYTATDGDGDTSSNTFAVHVTDDVPLTPASATLSIDEHGLVGSSDISASSSQAALAPGADGFFGGGLSTAINFTTLPSGLQTALGATVTIATSGATVTGTAGATVVFTLTVAADGTYTYHQDQPLFHSGAGADVKALNFGFTITDGDGDVSNAATITVDVTDDVPTVSIVAGGASSRTKAPASRPAPTMPR